MPLTAVGPNSTVSGEEGELAQELMSHEEELSADFYGRIVVWNCNVAHYMK